MEPEETMGQDAALVSACLTSPLNQGAWERLYRQLRPSLCFTVHQRLGQEPAQTVDDVVQESFVKIFLNLDSYDPAKGKLLTWASTIARNEAISFSRSRKASHCRNESLDEVREELLGGRGIWEWNDDVLPRLRATIRNRLGVRSQMVFDLVFDGLTLEAIGEKLDISKSTVGRTVQEIRALIGTEAQELPDSRG